MPFLEFSIKNLSGGVSTQRPELKFSNQVDEMINFDIDNDGSIRKRSGAKHINSILLDGSSSTSNIDGSKTLYFKNSNNKEFFISIIKKTNNNNLSVFVIDESGNKAKYTINKDNIKADDGSVNISDIGYFKIYDTIIIFNKRRTITKTEQYAESYWNNARKNVFFLWVKRAFNDGDSSTNNGYTYKVNIDGHSISVQKENTEDVASNIASSVNNISGYSAKSYGSIVSIWKDNGGEFTVKYGDNYGNMAMFGWYKSVEKPSDLPKHVKGFDRTEVPPVMVSGVEKNKTGNYYLKWDGEKWKECGKDFKKVVINNTPLALKCNGDTVNDFALEPIEFEPRLVGDDDSNPIPSFVDNTIENMFYYQNRLGILSEQSVILSRADDYFNFFNESAIDISPDDAIDLTIDGDSYQKLYYATVYAGGVVLWSEDNQYLLSSNGALTPTTANIRKTSSYKTSKNKEPISIDSDILFTVNNGSYLNLYSFQASQLQSDTTTAELLNLHCDKYIPSNISFITASKQSNKVFFIQEPISENGERIVNIFVYKYTVYNGEKAINSFYRYKLKASLVDKIIGAFERDDKIIIAYFKRTNEEETRIDFIEINTSKFEYNYDNTNENDTHIHSQIELSSFAPIGQEKVKDFMNIFLLKHIRVEKDGELSIGIYNKERNSNKVIDNKFVTDRPIYIGSTAKNIKLSFLNSNSEFLSIGSLYVSGELKQKFKRIDNGN